MSRCRDGTGELCPRPAEFFLLDEDGVYVPCGYMCREHAEDCIREYLDKLGWRWKAVSKITEEVIEAKDAKRIEKPPSRTDQLLETLAKLGFPT